MKNLPITALLLSSALSATVCADTIKIASVSPLSGSQAGLGEMIKLGAQLAIEEAAPWFKEKGIELVFSPQDDQASPDVGVATARRIVNDKEILGVIGHLNSGVAIPASEVYREYDLTMVSPANTNPQITERRYPNVNRICGRDDVQGPVGAEFAVNELGAKRIFVVHDKTTYGQGVAEAFRARALALGAEVVGYDGTEELSNFSSLILRMRVMKPDVVYFGGIYDRGGVLLKQMRERGITATYIGPDAMDSSEFVKIAQDAVVGAYYTTVAGPADQFPAARTFAERFKARFQKDAESYALYAYDCGNVFVAALKNWMEQNPGKIPTRSEVAQAVRAVNMDGITGSIAFDDKGDRVRSDYYIVKFETASYPGTTVKAITQTIEPAP
jgi:branched-chain amino acid transport system substrate-binding protein